MSLPRISIVTTCLKAFRFIEDTIRSVLSQNYPTLEYVMVGAGSTDGTSDIIAKYGHQLAHWECQPGCGQYDGINLGFSRVNGEVFGWINADDLSAPWALQTVGGLYLFYAFFPAGTILHNMTVFTMMGIGILFQGRIMSIISGNSNFQG